MVHDLMYCDMKCTVENKPKRKRLFSTAFAQKCQLPVPCEVYHLTLHPRIHPQETAKTPGTSCLSVLEWCSGSLTSHIHCFLSSLQYRVNCSLPLNNSVTSLQDTCSRATTRECDLGPARNCAKSQFKFHKRPAAQTVHPKYILRVSYIFALLSASRLPWRSWYQI